MRKISFVLLFVLTGMFFLRMQSVFADKVNPQLIITQPASNASLYQGQNVNVTVTMNPQAAQTADSLIIRLIGGGRTLAQTVVNNPQPNNQAQLQIPNNIQSYDDAMIQVRLSPHDLFRGNMCGRSVTVGNVNPQIRITKPVGNVTFMPGQKISVSVTINELGARAADSVIIRLIKKGTVITQTVMNNPRQRNQASLQLPDDISSGEVLIRAAVSPHNRFRGFECFKGVNIENTNRGLNIPQPIKKIRLNKGKK